MKINIHKSDIYVPETLSCHFDFNTKYNGSHRAFVFLSSEGEFQIRIDGVEYSTHEPSAKRNSLYSDSIKKLSNQMLSAINNFNDAFVNIAKHSSIFRNSQSIEKQISEILLKKYERKKFSLPYPEKEDVRTDLYNEAESKFFSLWLNRESKKNMFIEDNFEREYSEREKKWQELHSYHESIENFIEAKENSHYHQEYNTKRNALEDILYGSEDYVQKKLSEFNEDIQFPWPIDIVLDVNYFQSDRLIEAIVTLPINFALPDKKAVILSSGKISVKNKLKREVDIDTSSALLGLSYYLCSKLFDITTHVDTIRFSVVSPLYAYYWIEFDRIALYNKLTQISSLVPIIDFFYHPNVIDFNKNCINHISLSEFENRIQNAKKIAKSLAKNKNLVAISLLEAETICKRLPNVPDLQEAILNSKKTNSSIVIADKKYLHIIRELNFNEFDEFEPEEVSDSNEKKSEEQAKRTSLTKRFSSISNVSSLLEDAAKKAIKHFKYSVGMLQNDFSIDEQSATKLMNKLKNIGVVGSPDSDGFYPVLIDSEAVLTFKLSWSAE